MACSPTPIAALSFNKPTLLKRFSSPSMLSPKAMAKELYFNHDGSATKKLLVTLEITSTNPILIPQIEFFLDKLVCVVQAGVEMVAALVGVTLGPKGRNVVLENKYGPPKIVNDGETVLKQVLRTYQLDYHFVHLLCFLLSFLM